MTNNKTAFLRKRRFLFCIGILFFGLLIWEYDFGSKQPSANLGFTLNFNKQDIVVSNLLTNSPAWKAGIRENIKYQTINNISVTNFYDSIANLSGTELKSLYGNFFTYGQPVTLKDNKGNEYTFILEQLSVYNKLLHSPLFIKIKYAIALLLLLCGMGIILFDYQDTSIGALVYSIFFIAITTANVFDSTFSNTQFSKITGIILDFSLLMGFSSIFQYLSLISKKIHKYSIFDVIKYVPFLFLIIKIIHGILYGWDSGDNPLSTATTYIIIFCCALFIFTFLHQVISFPRNIPVIFRFFVLGLAFAVIPLLLQHFSFSISNSVYMSEIDKIYSVLSFTFLPFLLILAILHNLNLIRSKNVFWVTTYVAFAIICLPTLIITLEYSTIQTQKYFICWLMIISPIIFISIHFIIIKFFALNQKESKRILEEYKEFISPITDTLLLHKVTAQRFSDLLNCSYVFFYKKNNGIWDLLYEWGNLSESLRMQKLAESENKKRVCIYKDGSFSIPIVRETGTTGIIYIGPKVNGDSYLPGEPMLVEQMIRAFHTHYLMYTNKFLLDALTSKNQALLQMQEDTIISMANLIESRDGGTGAHVKRTSEYSVLITKKAMEKGFFLDEITEDFIELISKAAPMHDIGKIVVPDHILKKPGRFTPEEFDQMKLHTTEGERIVKEVLSASEDADYIRMTSNIAMYHHEKWDGSGYPNQLKESQIPLCARILAIADVFDALVSPRCYKEPMDPEKAFSIIKDDAGKHFDPILARVFLELKEEAIDIMKRIM